MDLGEIRWGGAYWIGLAQDKASGESSCVCGNEPSGPIKCWEIIEWATTGGVSGSG
jgi:hypothetical protein